MSGETPQYIEAVVAYVDLLGFKEMVSDADKDPSVPLAAIGALHSALSPHDSSTDPAPPTQLLTFSDSALFVFPTQPDGTKYAGKEVELTYRHIAKAQRDLLAQGLLVQGGIHRGLIYVDLEANTAFGPAFLDAYELQHKRAAFARVIVEPDLLDRKLKTQFLDSDWRSVITFGDGNWLVSYLYPESERPFSFKLDEVLKLHKDVVLQHAAKVPDAGALSKVVWAKMYHNAYVELYFRGKLEYDKLLIGRNEFFGHLLKRERERLA